ncbi:GNAT family acetyltransferase [Mycobacterium sp. 1100029.7]|nr:GNAT family acetyltransferase [Mycobacterium sp. 1100029.7]
MKSSDVKLRKAGPNDFDKVAQMHYPVWRQSWDGIVDLFVLDVIATPTLWATEKYPEALGRPDWNMWIAQAGAKTIGMTIFGPDATNPHDVLIEALYTTPEARKLGVSVRLLNKAVRSNPTGDAILWCAEKNSKARQFYEDNDFQPDGRTLTWEPLPGVSVPHVGYRRPADPA